MATPPGMARSSSSLKESAHQTKKEKQREGTDRFRNGRGRRVRDRQFVGHGHGLGARQNLEGMRTCRA